MQNMLNKILSFIGKKNSLIYLYNGLTAIVTILFGLLAIRIVGLNEYGVFVLLTSLMGVLLNVVGSRTSEGVTFFYQLNCSIKEDVVFSGYYFDLIVTLFFSMIIAITLFYIEKIPFLSSIEATSLVYYSVFSLIQILFGTSQGLWIAQNNYKKVSALQFFSALLRLIILVVISFLSEISHVELAICYALSAIVFLPHIVFNFLKNKCYIFKMDRIVNGFTKYSIKTFTSSLLKGGNKRIDNIIVGIFIDHSFLAVYDLCKKMLSPITFIVNPLANIFAPKFINNYKKNLFFKTKKVIYKSSLFIFLIQLLFFIVGLFSIYLFKGYIYEGESSINLYAVFISTLLTQSIIQQTWWCRPLSNAIEPAFSIYGNLILTILYFSIVYPASSFFGVVGFLYTMPISSVLLYMYWFFILERKSK
jgi:O-antigen/teichoic acid export membrane protein